MAAETATAEAAAPVSASPEPRAPRRRTPRGEGQGRQEGRQGREEGQGQEGGRARRASGADGPSIAAHPRAARAVARAKSWGGLAGFVLGGYLSLPTNTLAGAGLRALIAGVVCYVAVWAGAVFLWRRLVMLEIKSREQKLAAAVQAAQGARARRELPAPAERQARGSPPSPGLRACRGPDTSDRAGSAADLPRRAPARGAARAHHARARPSIQGRPAAQASRAATGAGARARRGRRAPAHRRARVSWERACACRNRRCRGESRRQEESNLKFPGALTIIGVGRHGVGPGPN